MTIKYRRKLFLGFKLRGTVRVSRFLNLVTFGYVKRRVKRDLRAAGLEVEEPPAGPGSKTASKRRRRRPTAI